MATHLTLTISSNDNGGRRGCRWARRVTVLGSLARVRSDCSAQLCSRGKPNLNAKHDPPSSSWSTDSKGKSLLQGFSFNGLLKPKPGHRRSCHVLKLGKAEGWYWARPPMVVKPCSSYIPYSLGIQGSGCSREKGVGR